jgi:hypothetical protein
MATQRRRRRPTTTSVLYRAARFSADARAVRRSIATGSPTPIIRRGIRRAVGRGLWRIFR